MDNKYVQQFKKGSLEMILLSLIGRIFIIPVEDSIRIRTGERGDISLYNAEQEK